MNYHVLVTAPSLADAGLKRLLDRQCQVHFVDDIGNSESVRCLLQEHPIDAVISRTMMLTAEMMDACPTLGVIAKHGVGVSNIDVEAATKRGIAVFSTPGANTRAVIEFTVGLMFASARRLPRFDRSVRGGQWSRAGDGLQLEGRRVGIVGFGQIGRGVATLATALGMEVMVYDPMVEASVIQGQGFVPMPSLESLLAQSQILSLHCPARLGAPPMLDAAALALLPEGALVVNTARGELIDEPALAVALAEGRLGGAALDTFVREPLPVDSPLMGLDNVILTPHVAGSTPQALANMASGAVECALAYLDWRAGLKADDRADNGEPMNIERLASLCINDVMRRFAG
ncbi:NAD(P)-dependent oxidoreductase [Salinicola peritrichatus]|uniref:NAD(P)-dependent oxidoreductase n=1 Tax=Salinicola peritrichatus TaxID=1267424 RepID=UPI000DA178E2|nr:NAD(P)-dependent oxidoreductase [Salinicola peritrichatus]